MNLTPDANALTGFDALDVALELNRRLRPLIEKIRRHDRKEAEQLQSAAQSMARNLSEGRRRLGRDRTSLWSVAAGSTDEARTPPGGSTTRISRPSGVPPAAPVYDASDEAVQGWCEEMFPLLESWPR